MNNREMKTKLFNKLEGGYTKSEINEIVDTFVEIMSQALSEGETVNITSRPFPFKIQIK